MIMATPYKNLVQLESVTNQYYAKHIAPILEREIKLIKEYNTKIVKEAYKEAKRNSAETTLSRIFIGGDLSCGSQCPEHCQQEDGRSWL